MSPPKVASLEVHPEDLKMLHETLCLAQWLVNRDPFGDRSTYHSDRIGHLIREVERHRPLGSNGKHGNLHTPTCGCDDK